MGRLRLHLPEPLVDGAHLELPAAAARHVQVWRLQPGDPLAVFDGRGQERAAVVAAMGRQAVTLTIGAALTPSPEPAEPVTLAVAMPANDRMDALVEKATELGVARICPLLCERSVLRLVGDRALRRCAHWRGVAASASEQCGRAVVPAIDDVRTLREFLDARAGHASPSGSLVLSLGPEARPLATVAPASRPHPVGTAAWTVLSGPEGGLSEAELAAAQAAGFEPVSLGPRTLRADTAPIAALTWLVLRDAPS